jgi:hypothetical protein
MKREMGTGSIIRRSASLVMTAVAALSVSACDRADTASGPRGVRSERIEEADAFVRPCETAVYGELAAGWRKNSIVAGPLAFVYGKDYARPSFAVDRGRNGRYHPIKVLVVVENGAVVTVAIPRAARSYASLFYDEARFGTGGRVHVAQGDEQVTFKACRDGESPYARHETQFNGGFIVAGSRCVPLVLTTNKDASQRRVMFSFAAGDCRGYTAAGK